MAVTAQSQSIVNWKDYRLFIMRLKHLSWKGMRCMIRHMYNYRDSTTATSVKSSNISSAHIYRPQRSWAKVIFSQAPVCPQGGGVCLSACWDIPPLHQTPRPSPQVPDPPGPPPQTIPPREADSSIRSTSGRYASYWNAFLFVK